VAHALASVATVLKQSLTFVVGITALALWGAADAAPAPSEGPPIVVGEEFVVFAEGPGKTIRGTPQVAFGGKFYLCVWREGWEGKNGGARICAARVSTDGRVLDSQGIVLAPNRDKDAPQEWPRVAFCNDTFLVVWQDLRNGADYDVLATRVSTAGKVLDAEPVKIAAGRHNQTLPDIASDGEKFLVVWQGFEQQDRAFHGYAATVDVGGKVGEPVEVGIAPQLQVAWDGTGFLAACAQAGFWQTGDVVRLGRDGKPVGEKQRATVRVGRYCLTGAPGKGWLLVTHRSPPDAWGWGGPGAMRCYFVLSNGTVDTSMPKEAGYPGHKKEPNWVDASTEDRAVWPYGPSAAAWDGRRTVVVWQRHQCVGEKKSMLANSDLMAARTDRWQRLDEDPIPVAATHADEVEPSLAPDGTGRLLCVYEKRTRSHTIICARLLTQAD
jgi:hypothetical protein